jgi:hypothetical protein
MTIVEKIEDLAATAARVDMPSQWLEAIMGMDRARWTHVEYDAVVRVLTASGQRKRTHAEMDAHQGGGASEPWSGSCEPVLRLERFLRAAAFRTLGRSPGCERARPDA